MMMVAYAGKAETKSAKRIPSGLSEVNVVKRVDRRTHDNINTLQAKSREVDGGNGRNVTETVA